MKKFLAILILALPIMAFSQLANYKASFSFGGGAAQYFGDLSHRFVNLKLTSYSANAALQFKPTKGTGIELEYKYVSLLGDDRASYFLLDKAKPNTNFNRSLNFKSSIHETNLKFYFYLNNGKIMSKYAVVSPYFFVGIGGGLFNSKSDLLSASGSYYYYWNDGTIRDLAETDPLSASANIITKDKTYETNLNKLETETKYSNFKWQIPLGFGLNFKLSKNIYLSLQTEWVYNSTDYLDGVGNKPKLNSYPNSFVEYAADPANTITGTRGNDNKWKDSYLNTTMKFNFFFGNKERKIAKNISSNIIVPEKDFNAIKKLDTTKVNIDTTTIEKQTPKINTKDTVVLIYKLIENVYVEQPVKRDTIIIYKTISKIKTDTVFQLDTVLNNAIIKDSIIAHKKISKIKTDTVFQLDTVVNNAIIKDSIITYKKNSKIKTDTVFLLDTVLKTPIIKDTLPQLNLKDSIKIENIIRLPFKDTLFLKTDIIPKIQIIDSTLIKQKKSLKTKEISKVKTAPKLDTVITQIPKLNLDTLKIKYELKSENKIFTSKVRDTVVVINTKKNNDSIVLSNHLILKNIYSNISNNNLLYDSISQKLSTILSKNNSAQVSQKIAVKNDTVYKYLTVDKISDEQLTELNNFKNENEKLKFKLENQIRYNDSINRLYLNTQYKKENYKSNTIEANGNLRTNTPTAQQNFNNQTPQTNLLPNELQEIIRQEFQKNNRAQNISSNSQELSDLKKEIEILKQQNQNNKTTIVEPKNNQKNADIESLKAEIEALKKINEASDSVVKTPIADEKFQEITILRNEIEQLKNQNNKIDTVVITTKNDTKDNELIGLKSDLDSYKKELEQIKAKQKLAAETKPKVEPKDSLLLQVFFATNQIVHDEKFNVELYNIYMMLLLNPDAKLLLTGFADRDGDKKYNLKLSAERAQSVKNYFVVDKKIKYNRILMNYVGSNLSNTTDNKNYNRRVDVYLIK